MSDLHPIKPGDRLPTRATTWNAMLAAARAHRYGTPSQPPAIGHGARKCTITVKNDTDEDLRAMDVVGLVEPLHLPEDNPMEFRRCTMLAEKYALDTHMHVAVLLQPLKAGAIGEAVIGGVTAAYISGHAFTGQMVGPGDDKVHMMASSFLPVGRIIWHDEENAPDERPALVALNPTASRSPTRTKLFIADETWVIPAGANQLIIYAVGGGGAGGNGAAGSLNSTIQWAGGGGAGGNSGHGAIMHAPASFFRSGINDPQIEVVVGAGGTAGGEGGETRVIRPSETDAICALGGRAGGSGALQRGGESADLYRYPTSASFNVNMSVMAGLDQRHLHYFPGGHGQQGGNGTVRETGTSGQAGLGGRGAMPPFIGPGNSHDAFRYGRGGDGGMGSTSTGGFGGDDGADGEPGYVLVLY